MRRSERSEGFTLLEVLIALIIFVTVMGGLIKLVSQNVRALGNARIEIELLELVESEMRSIQADAAYGKVPDLGETNGEFEAPFDHFRWERRVDYFSFALPEALSAADYTRATARSSVFGNRGAAEHESSVRVVVMRVFDEFGGQPVDPFVILTADPDAGTRSQSGFPEDEL
jgi:prepilin-type N-terminal cleavage/methylation domain-containing protein